MLQETITANVSEDAVTLEFQRSDGTLITQLVDFRNVSPCLFASTICGALVTRFFYLYRSLYRNSQIT